MKTSDMQSNFFFVGSRVVSFDFANDFILLNVDPHDVEADVICDIKDISQQGEYVSGIIHLSVSAQVDGKEEEGTANRSARFNLVLEGCFAAPEGTELEKMEKLLIINGSAMLYSTARAYISSVSALSLQSGKISLPTVNTFRLYEEYEARKSTEQ